MLCNMGLHVARTHPFHRKLSPGLPANDQHAQVLILGITRAYVDCDSDGGLIITHGNGEKSMKGGRTGRNR